jgi:hypothetical protein
METVYLNDWDFGEVQEAFKGKLFAFVAVVTKFGIGLGVAVANEKGYSPVPFTWAHSDTYEEMAKHAEDLNKRLGLDIRTETKIVCSSMRG